MDWQDKLRKKYPKIVGNIGFEHGKGWYHLIDLLCKKLQWDTDMNGQPQVEATQVKEKFGGLRFYTGPTTDRQDSMIEFAESLSYHVCERCGSTNRVKSTRGGWIQSLCQKCRCEDNKSTK